MVLRCIERVIFHLSGFRLSLCPTHIASIVTPGSSEYFWLIKGFTWNILSFPNQGFNFLSTQSTFACFPSQGFTFLAYLSVYLSAFSAQKLCSCKLKQVFMLLVVVFSRLPQRRGAPQPASLWEVHRGPGSGKISYYSLRLFVVACLFRWCCFKMFALGLCIKKKKDCTTVLSHWDFSHRKFGWLSLEKASCERVAQQNLWRMCWVF